MKSLTTSLLLLGCVFLMACQYSVPLSTEHNIDIDPALLGEWAMQPSEDDPNASLDSMSVTQFSKSEYHIKYVTEGPELLFRAYLIDPGGESLLQLELIGKDDSPIDENDDVNRFVVVQYALESDVVLVKTMNSELVSRDTASTQALLDAYLKNKDNPELFVDPGRFQKS